MGRLGRSGALPQRRIATARLLGTAQRHSRRIAGETGALEPAVADLRAISTDPELLGEVAAQFVVNHAPYAYGAAAVEMLVAAGADPAAIDRHAEVLRSRRRPGG